MQLQVVVHSAAKADQILEFKKSSSVIGEAMQQRRNTDDLENAIEGIISSCCMFVLLPTVATVATYLTSSSVSHLNYGITIIFHRKIIT